MSKLPTRTALLLISILTKCEYYILGWIVTCLMNCYHQEFDSIFTYTTQAKINNYTMDNKDSQRQSPPAMLNGKPLKPRKFRSSCDACSASKVKCDQGQPTCQRCVNLGLHCNYSPSRRMGKPPASARKINLSSVNVSSSESEQNKTPPAKKRQLTPPSFTNNSPHIPSIDNDLGIFDSTMMDTDDFMSINWQDEMFQPSIFETPSTADIQLTPSNLFDLSFDFMAETTPPMQSSQFIFGDDHSMSSRATSRTSTNSSSNTTNTSTTSFDNFQFPLPTPKSSKHSTPKLCTHNLDSLRNLPPSPITHSAASIDQVLINNKAAISNAYSLLSCSCSENPHFALTLALICTKILTSYEDIIKATNSPTSAISPTSGRRRSGSGFEGLAITVGAYKMDKEDEERMRIQIVVNELRKVNRLVDEYKKKYCSVVKGGEGIYSALEVFMRGKLTSTLDDLVRRLEC